MSCVEHDPGAMYCDTRGPGWTSMYAECEYCGEGGNITFTDSQVSWTGGDEDCTHGPDNVHCETASSMMSCMVMECYFCDAVGRVDLIHSKISWSDE